jgi:60 kDa SS-A/Ro ribonucleoprotein
MANKQLFTGGVSATVRASAKPDTTNRAGGSAFRMTAEHALAQFACTGTLNDTFYASAETQLKETLELAQKVSPEFLAKTAVYARQSGFMKDMPALLLAVLSTRDVSLFKKAFPLVIDNGKMLRNFVQIMRSGQVGRKSLGSAPKKAVREWLKKRNDFQVFRDSVGQTPSMADLIKMVHPTPDSKSREALYAYLLDKKLTAEQLEALPEIVKQYEAFKKDNTVAVPDVPFQMLTSLPLEDKHWIDIAKKAQWMMTRMNLNTFQRHGVFNNPEMVKLIADRLSSKTEVEKAKAFPYQLMTAFMNAEANVPAKVTNALQQAMEHATQNVPTYEGKVYVMIDVSGSMGTPITGARGSVSSKMSCRDVAALIASVVLRKNPEAEVIVFDTTARQLKLNPMDAVMTNAGKISTPGGGTDCSAPLRMLNAKKAKGDLLIMVSDNESWSHPYDRGQQAEWDVFKSRNPEAKLVCIDIQAGATTQSKSSKDTLNIGGFSDQVFEVVNAFVQGDGTPTFWASKIAQIAL